MTLPVYLDVDTGIDDALAILLAVLHPGLEVRGVTTVAGNVELAKVTANTRRVLDTVGADHVPVVSGAARPLVGEPHPASHVHGEDGLGGADLPPPSRPPDGEDAVAFLRRELARAEEPVTLIALGPLTNLALLLQTAPDLRVRIGRLALMGGAVASGNVTPAAEFNIWHDPEAADVVFRSGVPLLVYTWDVFVQVGFTAEEVERWFDPSAGPAATLVGHLLRHEMGVLGRPAASIGDAGCVACVIDPSGLRTEDLPVFVETAGVHTRGQTVVDRRVWQAAWQERPQTGIEVALDIEPEVYRRLFRETIAGASRA